MAKQSIKSILDKRFKYNVCGKVWIECNEEKFFGPGRVELLEGIEKTGSINKAAREMGMSYKKAWEMVNALNAQTLRPFVITKSGGVEGGGSVLTPEAKSFIDYHHQLQQRFLTFLEAEKQLLFAK